MTIFDILEELNVENGSNYKLSVLKKHKDNALLQRVFKLTMDTITYTYGVSVQRWYRDERTMHTLTTIEPALETYTLEDFLDLLEFKLATRELTGNAAFDAIDDALGGLSVANSIVALRVLGHDLKVNVGSTLAMKVWKDLVQRPMYMRCGVYGPKSKKDIKFPAILQLKADGTYRETHVSSDGTVTFYSRSGHQYEYPTVTEDMKRLAPGHYVGELTVKGAENRSIGNGLINSDDVPHDQLVYEVWDFITEEEYSNARKKIKNKTPYKTRLQSLRENLNGDDLKHVTIIETHIVNNLAEAADQVSKWMEAELEGGVLKDQDGVFANTTSKHQLKMKLAMSVEVRVYGFQEGTPGTKRENTFGAILWQTDDGKVKGKTSGFTDKELEEINNSRSDWIDAIITVEANDITKATNSETYALSHPRFKERRFDKTETDDLARIFEIREMAREFQA